MLLGGGKDTPLVWVRNCLIKLSPVTQRSSTFTNGVDGRTKVLGREFESHHPRHQLPGIFKETFNLFIMSNLIYTLPGSPNIETASW